MTLGLPVSDLSQCDAEPIRLPGAIQPHGRLLAVHAHTSALCAYSANWPDADAARAAAAALSIETHLLVPDDAPARIGSLTLDGRRWDASAHRSGERVIVEFEAAGTEAEAPADLPIYVLARSLLPALQHAPSVAALAQLAAVEMQRLTGFGRCLVYRFDDDGHGHVLGEAADAGYDRYLGHRFPGADIPQQARALYLLNRIRLIPDAGYTPVPLVVLEDGVAATDLDLSQSALRSVSPVHLEYMRNMGTAASMSVSLVIGGRLWGLVSCHDHDPRRLPFHTRMACEHLGQLLALQIEARETTAHVAEQLELRKLTLQIVSHLAESDATLQRLMAEPLPLLRMARATGAAVVLDDRVWTTGEVPPAAVLRALAEWVALRGGEVFDTDALPAMFPAIAPHADRATGLLALSISQVHRHLILWFRPELVQTVRWAGDPRKEAFVDDGRIHPRRSFASWQEELHGRSAPWSPAEVGAAGELRQALIGVVLRRAEEMAAVATELGRVNKELEAFSYTVSHDLRAPMRHIAGYADLLLEMPDQPLNDRARRYLGNVKDAAAFAGQLVDSLLNFSRMGRSAMAPRSVSTATLVQGLVQELSRHERQRAIEWQIADDLPTLHADPLLLQVAVRNLLGNAVKYTRTRAIARIAVRTVQRPEGSGLEVIDNGVGFQMKYVGKLFGVFQRLHAAEDFEGTGIGLATVKRIVERHGGHAWAVGEPNVGATFGFVLPPAPPASRPEARGAAGTPTTPPPTPTSPARQA